MLTHYFKQEIFSHVAINNKKIVKDLRFMSFIEAFLLFLNFHSLSCTASRATTFKNLKELNTTSIHVENIYIKVKIFVELMSLYLLKCLRIS